MSEAGVRRVLMTTDTVGGVWTFTTELCRQFSRRGIDVILATLGDPPDQEKRGDIGRLPGVRLVAGNYRLEWMEEPWADVEASAKWLEDLAAQCRPDVIHLNSFGQSHVRWSFPVVLTAHSCVLSWWRAVRGEVAPAAWDRYRECVAGALRNAVVVTAPTAAFAATLPGNYAFRGETRAILNGRDPEGFRVGRKEPVVFTAGRLWDEAKNVRAVARVAGRLPWSVCAAGDWSQGEPPGAVHALGRLSACRLAEWYERAAIFALPARYEPFGLAALEAALSGCALVLGDIASQREVWRDAALFVPPEDEEALERCIRALTDDAALRAAMAGRARSRALELGPEAAASAYLDAYRLAAGKFSSGERRYLCAS